MLARGKIITMPCCYDPLTARITEAPFGGGGTSRGTFHRTAAPGRFATVAEHDPSWGSARCCLPRVRPRRSGSRGAPSEAAGYELTFMTGFGVSAAHGYPDCQLVSYQDSGPASCRGGWGPWGVFAGESSAGVRA